LVEQFDGNFAVLRGESARHLGRILRAEVGQMYELSDGSAVWLGRVERVGRDAIEFTLVEPLPAREPSLVVTLLLSIVKFDRFEWCLAKATELGAAEVVPLAAVRCDKALVSAAAKRAHRWEKILFESAQQARRLRPPVLSTLVRPPVAFARAQATSKIVLSERPDAPSLRAVLERQGVPFLNSSQRRSAVLAVGPEGGWTQQELAAARGAGFAEASLGMNILRTETAVVAALAILNYALGD